MLNISLFDRELTEPAVEMETTDLGLAKVLSLVAADRFTEAAESAQTLWEEKHYDLRLFGYFLFGAFLQHGLESLPEILGCVVQTLSINWEKVGPQQKKETHGDSTCKWLFSRLVHELKLHERLKDSAWESWNGAEAAAVLRQSIEQIPAVHERLVNRFDECKSLPYLQQLEAMLTKMERSAESIKSGSRSSRDSIRVGFSSMSNNDSAASDQEEATSESSSSRSSSSKSSSSSSSEGDSSEGDSSEGDSSGGDSSEGESSSDDPESSAGEDKKEDEEADKDKEDASASSAPSEMSDGKESESASAKSSPSAQSSSADAEEDDEDEKSPEEDSEPLTSATSSSEPGKTTPVSVPLLQLMHKITAFGRLVRRRDYKRAAIVAADVMKAFESFDPRLYLPSIFTPFFSLLSHHGDKVEPLMKEPDGLSGRALRHLYEVDLDAFVRGQKR